MCWTQSTIFAAFMRIVTTASGTLRKRLPGNSLRVSRTRLPHLMAMLAAVVPVHGSARAQPCIDPPPNMLAWWPGDDCLASDLVGTHDGTYEGFPTCPVDAKVGGGAMSFAPGTYIVVPEHDALDMGTGDLTLDAWVQTSVSTGVAPILSKRDGVGLGYSLHLSDGLLTFELGTTEGAYTFDSTAPAIADGFWHHVAVTVDRNGDAVSLYVDGSLAVNGSHDPALITGSGDNAVDLLVGALPLDGSPTVFFDGSMDEIEIFNRALGAAELLAIFDADSDGKCKCTAPPTDLFAWWPLDETFGTTAHDVAGAHDAAYVGSPTPEPDGKVAGGLNVSNGNLLQSPGQPFNLRESDFSIDAWVRYPTGSTGEHWIVDREHEFHLAANPSEASPPHLQWDCGMHWWPDPIPLDEWTHIALTVERSTADGLKKYVNGTIVGMDDTCAYDIDYLTVPLGIGGDHGSGTGERQIDEVEIFRRALAPHEVQAIYEAGSAGKCKSECVDPPTEMVGWWPGDDCTPADLLGHHDGTFVGFPVCEEGAKVGLGALSFSPGTGEYVVVEHAQGLNFGWGELTIDAWIKTRTDGQLGSRAIVTKDMAYELSLCNGKLRIVVCADLTCYIAETSVTVNDGQWHHVAGVLFRSGEGGPGVLLAYVDGVERGTNAIGALGNVGSSHDLIIGAFLADQVATGHFDGMLDEIEIFRRALTAGEIRAIYEAGSWGKCKRVCVEPPARIIAWWPLDEESGRRASDIVGGMHGAYFDAPTPSTGKVAGALSFRGSIPGVSNDYVVVGPNVSLGGEEGFTIDAWVKWIHCAECTGEHKILDKGFHDGWHFAISEASATEGSLHFDYHGTGHFFYPNYIPPDTWTHVAVSGENGSVTNGYKLYVNGVFAARGSFPYDPSNPFDLTIGEGFSGEIDEIEIFARALDPTEVQAIYLAGGSGKCKARFIPVVSEWGLVVLTLVIVTAATILLRRRRGQTAGCTAVVAT